MRWDFVTTNSHHSESKFAKVKKGKIGKYTLNKYLSVVIKPYDGKQQDTHQPDSTLTLKKRTKKDKKPRVA